MLWSKGQNETVTLATCFRVAPLMSAILRNSFPGSSLLLSRGIFARGPWELVSILKWQTRDRSIDDIISKPVHLVFCEYYESLSAPSFRSIVEVCDSLKMPRNGRRKRSLSSEEGSLVSYYSKHRFIDREHSPVSDTRHYKRGSSTVRSRDRRHNRHLSRNRSRSTRRSDRRLKRQKCRNDPSEVSTVRNSFLPIFWVF